MGLVALRFWWSEAEIAVASPSSFCSITDVLSTRKPMTATTHLTTVKHSLWVQNSARKCLSNSTLKGALNKGRPPVTRAVPTFPSAQCVFECRLLSPVHTLSQPLAWRDAGMHRRVLLQPWWEGVLSHNSFSLVS